MKPIEPQAPRNLVVMCDGTNNQVEGHLSNVLKLFRMCEQNDGQRVFYDPGVGTIGNDSTWGRLRQKFVSVLSLATGAGLDDNVLEAYRFLITAYRPGDRIYLFGFSRGAYTVRVLAGLIHMIGILQPDQVNLAGFALNAYKHSAESDDFRIAWDFGRIVQARRAPVHFMGVWDTVASMIVPRPDRFYIPSLRMLPYTRTNPSVRAFRHAIAIDERRRMFRLNRWNEGQKFCFDPQASEPVTIDQDCAQHWFAGNHSDVGGGYPEDESGLSKFPLEWIGREAETHGLALDAALFRHLALGETREGQRVKYVAPDALAPLHDSLTGGWWILEWLPKRSKWRETRKARLPWYLPRGEPRHIPGDAVIAPSAQSRRSADSTYHPDGFA